eukprot:TRINITY_DN12740_c0_g1_i1.p1 TRINITY_DN12740_c0_g1~~TRINITY_DN12740_c0_g1_i1.p1  ORF type:complete len:176 (+),score=23.19 TRINITY_DN12740_c0_g1_i1:129-656(+)
MWMHLLLKCQMTFALAFAAMSVSRFSLGIKDHLWVDFTSWLHCGKSGMYVVGSAKLDKDFSLDELDRSIFENEDLHCVPSKYFACMYDAFSNSYRAAFSDKDKERGELLLKGYPILRKDSCECYEEFHKLYTVEDLAKELMSGDYNSSREDNSPREDDSPSEDYSPSEDAASKYL